jgi:hypothetical protein
VVNCLSCGKIYDCRSVTNDIIKFLGEWQGKWVGLCSCGKPYLLSLRFQVHGIDFGRHTEM